MCATCGSELEAIIKDLIETIISSQNLTAKNLGIRLDRVALRLLNELENWSQQSVPKHKVLLLAMTAPIRLPAKTETTLKATMSAFVTRARPNSFLKIVVNKNRIRLLVVESKPKNKIRFIGFVHNPIVKSESLLNLSKDWLLFNYHSAGGKL